jgi:adenosylcobinamide kinase / adenosylcobinamide-phosphate guanylyltransferase
MFIFVTGGQRSGRSNYGLRRASELGPPPWRYVTSGDDDESARRRIERTRKDQEAIWQVAPMPTDLGTLLKPEATAGLGAIVLDSFSSWLSSHMAGTASTQDQALLAEVEQLADRFYRSPVPLVIISQELNMGDPPADAGAERYIRTIAGANQLLAGMAQSVVLLVSGVPLKVR